MTTTFNEEYLNFLTELAFNNEKPWFDRNRGRYEQFVREPFKQFAVEMSERIAEFDPTITPMQPKDMLFRINRDLRFSKDKTPYNTWMSAVIAPGGKKKSDERACYYFRFAVDNLALGGGVWQPNKDMLQELREKIVKKHNTLQELLSQPDFKQNWGDLRGDENKIIPKPFKDSAESIPLVKKKNFTFFIEKPETDILRPDLQDWMVECFKSAYDVKTFLDVNKT